VIEVINVDLGLIHVAAPGRGVPGDDTSTVPVCCSAIPRLPVVTG
jgi:hypothetical protein